MTGTVVAALMLLAVFGVTVASCVSDIRSMRIPNWHSGAVLAGFALAFIASPESFGPWWEHAGALALMFAVTFGMFCANMMGSGDTKLGSALALWIGLKGMVAYLVYMGLAGGILALAAMYLARKKPFPEALEGSWVAQVQNGRSAIPYGVAISFGSWSGFLHTQPLRHISDELFKIIH